MLSGAASDASAQTGNLQVIRVESHEVVLPLEVIRETKSTGVVEGPDGQQRLGWVLRSKEVTGLSVKSVHVFDDGVEAKIQHFSLEKINGWEVRDNIGHHAAYSCTPRGIWVGPDIKKGKVNDSRIHTYLVTYVPPPSLVGSCHRISIKVDRRHTKVFGPSQYCNTKDPLSDPLKDTELGNKLLASANSNQFGGIPLSVAVSTFASPSGAGRVNLVADIPANLLERHWDGFHLVTSIAVLGLVFDRTGTLVTRFSDTACLPPEESIGYQGPLLPPDWGKEEVEQSDIPIGYQTQVDLNPGHYQFEFLLTDGEKFGRANASLTVPDFSTSALSMSDIALCKRYHRPSPDERGPTRAPQSVSLMFDGQEFTPAGDTHFQKGEQLMAYVEVYSPQPGSTPPHEFLLEMKVTDTKTGELRIGTGPRPVEPSTKSGNTVPVVWTMEIDKLPPSTYRLEAQVSDSAGNKTAWRTAFFVLSDSPALPQSSDLISSSQTTNLQSASPPDVLAQGVHAQDLSASELLRKIAKTYEQASTFSVVAEKKVDLDTDTNGSLEGPAHMSDDIQVTLMVSSSSKAKLLLKDGNKEVVVVCDGKVVTTLIPTQHIYEESTVVSVQTPFFLHRIGTTPILGADLLRQYEILLAARYKDLSTYERWAKLEQSENVKVGKDRRECYVLTIQMPRGAQMPGDAQKQKLWVDKTAFTIWKSVETTTSVDRDLRGAFDPGVSLRTTVTVTMKQIALNPPLDDSNFVFTPPDQAKQVGSLKLSGRNPF